MHVYMHFSLEKSNNVYENKEKKGSKQNSKTDLNSIKYVFIYIFIIFRSYFAYVIDFSLI